MAKFDFIDKGIVEFLCADGSRGYPAGAPYDRILAGAAAFGQIPQAWKEQLAVGGRIVAPVDMSIVLIERNSDRTFTEKDYFGFSFVPLIRE